MTTMPHQPPAIPLFEAPTRANRAIGAARERFLASGHILDARVRPEIATAWQRSFLHGVRPDIDRAPAVVDAERWCRSQSGSDFGSAALDVLGQFDGMLDGTRSVLVLADGNGQIFHVAGDAETRRELERINFMPGAAWDEDRVGPNGVGTPLRSGHTDLVFGNEHYCAGWLPWACIGSPVRDAESGRIVGVIDLTCPTTHARRDMLVTVASIARNVAQLIEARESARREGLLREFHDRDRRSGNDGLIVLTRKGRIVELNDHARQMLGNYAVGAVGQPLLSQLPPMLQRVFRSVRIDVQSALDLDVDDETIRGLNLEPLRDVDRRLTGYALRLRAVGRAAGRPAAIDVDETPIVERRSLRASTNELIRRTLAECNGEVGRAARRLGIARSTLYRRMKQAGESGEPVSAPPAPATRTNGASGH